MLLIILLHSMSVSAQTGTEPNITGQWSGSFEISAPNGSVQRETIWLDLKQNGAVISGTAGANAERQTAITDGEINGNRIFFRMNVRAGTVYEFNLAVRENRLEGEVAGDTGGAKIKVNAERVAGRDRRGAASNLEDEIQRADQEMFDAFNRRDLEKFRKFFSRDLEFYQDLTGVTGYRQNIAAFKTNFAKKATVRRELKAEDLEIYPLKNYGAIEIGTHRFWTREPGRAEELTAEVKFVHIWRKSRGVWKITRVVSYGH